MLLYLTFNGRFHNGSRIFFLIYVYVHVHNTSRKLQLWIFLLNDFPTGFCPFYTVFCPRCTVCVLLVAICWLEFQLIYLKIKMREKKQTIVNSLLIFEHYVYRGSSIRNKSKGNAVVHHVNHVTPCTYLTVLDTWRRCKCLVHM